MIRSVCDRHGCAKPAARQFFGESTCIEEYGPSGERLAGAYTVVFCEEHGARFRDELFGLILTHMQGPAS